MTFRLLRTWCAAGAVSRMRMRATRAPSGPVASSTAAPDTMPFAPSSALRAPFTSTSRRSMNNVSGSGRLVTYATGSVVSMLTVVMRRPALVDMPLNRGAGPALSGAPASPPRSGGGAKASSGVSPAAHNPATRSSTAPAVRTIRCVLFAIFRGPESLSHFALFHQRERIVDFLHDDDALRRYASNHAVQNPIVHMR